MIHTMTSVPAAPGRGRPDSPGPAPRPSSADDVRGLAGLCLRCEVSCQILYVVKIESRPDLFDMAIQGWALNGGFENDRNLEFKDML